MAAAEEEPRLEDELAGIEAQMEREAGAHFTPEQLEEGARRLEAAHKKARLAGRLFGLRQLAKVAAEIAFIALLFAVGWTMTIFFAAWGLHVAVTVVDDLIVPIWEWGWGAPPF